MQRDRAGNAKFSRLTLLFLGILVVPAITLVALGVILVGQDKTIAAQRAVERREAAADRAVRTLELRVADLERQLLAGDEMQGAVRLAASGSALEARPARLALWLPGPLPLIEAESNTFQEAEALEFCGAPEKSIPIYEAHARSGSPATQAGALIRLARVYRNTGRVQQALAAYRELSRIDGVWIESMPADLLARRWLCDLLEESGRSGQLATEAAALREDLIAGRWRLDRAGWTLAAEQAGRWTAKPVDPAGESLLVSEAAECLWQEWKQTTSGSPARRGSRTFAGGNAAVTMVWHISEGRASAAVILQPMLRKWAEQTAVEAKGSGTDLTLMTEQGLVLFGRKPETGAQTVQRNVSQTGLPWVLLISPDATARNGDATAMRRALLMLGLAAILVFLAAGIILLWWAVRRELTVAQLQADFVSAVSHEFRTPLTTMRHASHLLEEDDEAAPERRKSLYSALSRNTDRLQRLVESLLDFARMERGKRSYDLSKLDARAFTSKIVGEFRKEAGPRGFELQMETAPEELPVLADGDALGQALWNLLDNAVKYSGDCREVQVAVGRSRDRVAISVRDRGLGIPAAEQKAIFRKFVRGAQARRLGIQGTGLGLAMAGHIVAAHHGRIEVKSVEGHGSEFSILLPLGG